MMPPIKRAVRDNDVAEVRRLIAAGYDVNASDIFGNALLISCQRQSLETMKALFEGGIDPNRGYKSDSPLAECAKRDRLDMVKYLVEHGAWIRKPEIDAARHNPELYAYLSGTNTVNVPRVAAALPPAATPAQTAGAVTREEMARIVAEAMRSAQAPVPAPTAARDASAEPAYRSPARPNDLAVIIGIEEYSDAPKAVYAERDAEAFRAHARALGVPERNIAFLKGSKAGKGSFEKYIEQWLPRLAKPESRVYFYFSGHGAPDVKTGQAYLVPWDGDPNFLETTAYPTKRLYEKLSALPAEKVLVAMDACFSGAGGRSLVASGARPLVGKVDTGSAGRVTALSASAANEISGSLDAQQHGAFTYFLLQGLNGAAKDAAGHVTVKSLHSYLTPRVQDEARRLNRDQTPQLTGADPGLILR